MVVEATGAASVLEDSINYVAKGDRLVVYGVYGDHARVSWLPHKIWSNEIIIMASFCATSMFPTALKYLPSGRVSVEGIVSKNFRIHEWSICIEAMAKQEVVKAAVVFDS